MMRARHAPSASVGALLAVLLAASACFTPRPLRPVTPPEDRPVHPAPAQPLREPSPPPLRSPGGEDAEAAAPPAPAP